LKSHRKRGGKGETFWGGEKTWEFGREGVKKKVPMKSENEENHA